jgi:hypothetical protein
MQQDEKPRRGRDFRTYAIAAVIVVLVIGMVVLHLTGVVGPRSH